MAAKITRKDSADQTTRPAAAKAKPATPKKPALKHRPAIKTPVKALERLAAEKPARKVRETKPKPEAKGRLSKDLSATPTKTKVAKPKPLQFRKLWSEKHPTLKDYVGRFGDMDSARLYIDYAEGEAPGAIRFITSEMLCKIHEGSDQDVDRAYRRALISYNLGQLEPEKVMLVHRLYSAQSIANWHKEISHPSEETLEELESHGIYLCAGSVLMMDEFQQPPKVKASVAHTYESSDDIFNVFTKRDLERCAFVAQDYERNSNLTDFDDYENLGKSEAFRAMLELWPSSFRHYVNEDVESGLVAWTLITNEFKAVVSRERCEVIIGTDGAGYTLYADASSLDAALERVFCYFDTMGTDQLAGLLKTVGFDQLYVGGMKFDLMAERSFNPFAFVNQKHEHAVEIYHNSSRLSAADFLLLSAQTTRGVFIERAATHGTFDEYDVIVADMSFRVMYLDKTNEAASVHHCVASLNLHQGLLNNGRQVLEAHGVYVDENAVMHLPVSDDAQERFFPEVENSEDEILFISSVTFV